jgi:hypothetical protein
MIPPFTPGADRSVELAAYLAEHTGHEWSARMPGAQFIYGPIRVVAYEWSVGALVGGVHVMLHEGQIVGAIPLLRDPAALRTRVREELARALATIDTEPTP